MHIGFYNFYTAYNRNRMFLSPESTLGDNLAAPFVDMARMLADRGHRVSTIDTAPLESYDAIVFLDYPTRWNAYFRRAVRLAGPPLYLVLQESQAIRPDNYRAGNHRPFRTVFTWHDGVVDGKRYVKWYNPVDFGSVAKDDGSDRRRLCALVAGNKFSNHPAELYAARRDTLNWFATHAPGDMALYGEGWDRWFVPRAGFLGNALLAKLYRSMPGLPRRRPYPFWKGTVRRKMDVLRDARFSICYENAAFPGYITEKIFDCFFAGCVPVYWGAPNVTDYIPSGTFIDRGRFKSHDDLHDYLRGMPRPEYDGYRAAIAEYLVSEQARLFGAARMTDVLLRHVVDDAAN
jgi:hypothetical protein